MLSAAQQTFLTSLQVKKYRQKYRKFLVEGTKIVGELLEQERFRVHSVFGTERWAKEYGHKLSAHLNIFNEVTEAELKKISSLNTPNQVLAVAEYPESMPDLSELLMPGTTQLFLYLDGLQDPGNMGTILRLADWFSLSAVLCSPDCVDAFSPKVIQAGMGACLRVPVVEDIELEAIAQAAPQLTRIGALMEGIPVYGFAAPAQSLLVIGNEGKGIRDSTLALLQYHITIPRPPGSAAESLNAGVAAGILVSMLHRHQQAM